MNDKILTLLGFASKSGNLSNGADSVKEMLKKHKAKLVIIAKDISEKSRKEIKYFASQSSIPVIDADFDIETLSHATGKKGGILSVNEIGFANAIRGGNANGKN
ncbi:MAG: ribosomal L7Ae/L30e/S12e/Gadd45 family protein [Acutalibacteraceae bacterium]|nr:ribosomal L7Ae/L30e/S12e/Gadd45 family protein [Acutalibacteraceae bacterium]